MLIKLQSFLFLSLYMLIVLVFFLKFIKVDIFLSNIFRKDVSGGASKDKIYNEWFPERKLGVTTVFFPRGLDLRLKHFLMKNSKKYLIFFYVMGNLIKN